VHLTFNGLSEETTYLGDVNINREFTLQDLREIIWDLPSFETARREASLTIPDVASKWVSPDQLRVRTRQSSYFFGRILREVKKPLKQQNVQNMTQIVVQPLEEIEELDPKTFILLICRRDVQTRTYGPKTEFKFTFPGKFPRFEDLEMACRVWAATDLPISIAKYVPTKFKWAHIDPEEEVVEKRKKGKEIRYKVKDGDLKKMPVLLKDGDILGVRVEEGLAEVDDFQTEEDKEAYERYMAEHKVDPRRDHPKGGDNGRRHDAGGVWIDADFDDEDPDTIQKMIDEAEERNKQEKKE